MGLKDTETPVLYVWTIGFGRSSGSFVTDWIGLNPEVKVERMLNQRTASNSNAAVAEPTTSYLRRCPGPR